MTKEKVDSFFYRIDQLTPERQPLFGEMNVNQMICHCSDALRMALGEKRAEEYGKINPTEIVALTRSGRTDPAPKGFDQVKGEGTKPISLQKDKTTLKEYIISFSELAEDFNFPENPYFGKINRMHWESLMDYHLDHHLKQFGV